MIKSIFSISAIQRFSISAFQRFSNSAFQRFSVSTIQRFGISVIFISLLISPLFADKYAGEFLNLGIGVKAKSMGDAFVALADNSTSVFWNPAGGHNINAISFDIMHCEEYGGALNYDSFSLIYPLENKTHFGFLLSRIGVSGIPFTELTNPSDTISSSNPPVLESKNTYADYTGYLSFSSKFLSSISIGVSTKFIYKNIENISASGFGCDLGFLYHPKSNLSFGLNIRDLFGTKIWWADSDTETINPNLLLGLAYNFSFPIITKPAIISFQSDIYFEDRETASQIKLGKISSDVHTGLQIELFPFLSLFSGLERNNKTAGLQISHLNYNLNYSFEYNPDFSSSHRISFGMKL